MISSGCFQVNKEVLVKLGRIDGMRFLEEMRDYGGRISHHEYKFWLKEMGWSA